MGSFLFAAGSGQNWMDQRNGKTTHNVDLTLSSMLDHSFPQHLLLTESLVTPKHTIWQANIVETGKFSQDLPVGTPIIHKTSQSPVLFWFEVLEVCKDTKKYKETIIVNSIN